MHAGPTADAAAVGSIPRRLKRKPLNLADVGRGLFDGDDVEKLEDDGVFELVVVDPGFCKLVQVATLRVTLDELRAAEAVADLTAAKRRIPTSVPREQMDSMTAAFINGFADALRLPPSAPNAFERWGEVIRANAKFWHVTEDEMMEESGRADADRREKARRSKNKAYGKAMTDLE